MSLTSFESAVVFFGTSCMSVEVLAVLTSFAQKFSRLQTPAGELMVHPARTSVSVDSFGLLSESEMREGLVRAPSTARGSECRHGPPVGSRRRRTRYIFVGDSGSGKMAVQTGTHSIENAAGPRLCYRRRCSGHLVTVELVTTGSAGIAAS
jgi:hypothetical protein